MKPLSRGGLRIGLLLAMIAYTAVAQGRSGWTPPPGEHPRLVFKKADVPALKAKMVTARGRRCFDMIRSYADNNILNPKGLVPQRLAELDAEIAVAATSGVPVQIVEHSARAGALQALENAAFVYAMTGEERYGKAAVDGLVRLLPYVAGMSLRPAALIYDWCHPLFTEAQKTLVRKQITRLCGELLVEIDTRPYALGDCPPEVPQAIYWGLLTSANIGIGQLAIEGEPEFNQAWLDRSRQCSDLSLNRFLDEEGYHENGPAYLGFGFSWFNFYMEALRLRGADWANHPRLGKTPYWYAWLIMPGSLGVAPATVPVGNANFGMTSGQDAFMWLYHA
ncbi:MAG: hypothetical protein PHR35_17975, partial [Kiritimatiellae bacterium]|nr:hypothetical protein [Kiritimatiellia bacterium]